ncbi:inactive protein RESTRICTED TEV MOVEMENT 1-like [Diospyros lotus]|uniref:inactive protein RESTRICTED TEV MOVEMENT 1-like n=1 Tax=Diospyros lotus TaxID=55363 RepID=UPI0022569E17|nr:inactive protein RESTRICTED TEV MOVEMENT 1-like [Diospyros lotus]XP_052207931.1 inactive protein RESTRICTED TEV MOVEMENT 1-like [Diospyros lotus]XP_052207932.1 inactive protein RESTRICTED TEV MOVEMENT 1-like [Diospyros lotus]
MIRLPTLGSQSGQTWDHKGRTELVQIFVSYDDSAINFLQFLYAENGSLVLSERPDYIYVGNNFSTVTLQYPDEFLTSLKGTWNYGKLTSIECGTNLGRHGPFGRAYKDDKHFDFQLGNHRAFGGFHGTTSRAGTLESIGIYVKPIASLSNLNSDQQVNVSKSASKAEVKNIYLDH